MKQSLGFIVTIVGLITMAFASFQDAIALMYAGGALFLVGQVVSAPTRIAQKPVALKKSGYPWPTNATRSMLFNLLIAGLFFVTFLNATEENDQLFQAMVSGVFLIYALIEAIRDYRWRGPRER
jgi:hypothetical protein